MVVTGPEAPWYVMELARGKWHNDPALGEIDRRAE